MFFLSIFVIKSQPSNAIISSNLIHHFPISKCHLRTGTRIWTFYFLILDVWNMNPYSSFPMRYLFLIKAKYFTLHLFIVGVATWSNALWPNRLKDAASILIQIVMTSSEPCAFFWIQCWPNRHHIYFKDTMNQPRLIPSQVIWLILQVELCPRVSYHFIWNEYMGLHRGYYV